MRSIHIFLVIFSFFLISCKEKNNHSNLSSVNNQYRDSSFNFIMKKFGLPYSENVRLDSNSLIFYCTRTFDTSFLIHLKHGVTETNGVVYQIIPTYHNNINDFAIERNQLLYFEGYSFTLDSTKWEVIKRKAGKMLVNDTSFKSNDGCRDCEEYVLSHNFKSSKSNIGNTDEYESLYKFLNDSLLKNFIQSRKPMMYKMK